VPQRTPSSAEPDLNEDSDLIESNIDLSTLPDIAKDHKQYEYGNKVSIVSTKDTNIIVGVASHDKNININLHHLFIMVKMVPSDLSFQIFLSDQ
jgi:hypothetical protein